MIRSKARKVLEMNAAAALAALVVTSTPALAQDDDPYGCNQYALTSCQVDGDDSYECFIERYNACVAFHEGGGSGLAGQPLLREELP